MNKFNVWSLSSFVISFVVIIPILTVSVSFFEETSNYYQILKDTFLLEYIFNSVALLMGVLILTFLMGAGSAYLVSFFNFPGSNFFKWTLILSFAVPPYIYAYSLTAFFENYGTLYSILKNLFGERNYNQIIPKFDGLLGVVLSISFSLYAYVYILARASFLYQSQNIIDLGKIMQPESTLGLIFLFLAVVVMAPIGEEVVFRGFLQKFLEEYWKDITRAVLVTSLFFAMIHFNPYWTIQIYLLGVILGFLSWRTNSIIPSIILHSMNNGIAFILTVVDESNLGIYLWNENVSPLFIAVAIYLIYSGLKNITQNDK